MVHTQYNTIKIIIDYHNTESIVFFGLDTFVLGLLLASVRCGGNTFP